MTLHVPHAPGATRDDASQEHAVRPAARGSQSPIRVVIVDDHLSVSQMLQRMLEWAGGFQVLALAQNGISGLALANQHRPDVLLLDLCLPDISGLEVARQIHDTDPAVAVLVITRYYSLWDPRPLVDVGVRGCLPKTTSIDELVNATRAVAQGASMFLSGAVETERTILLGPLTARERDVLQLLLLGRRNREIADELSIAESTLEKHLKHIYAKLGVKTRAEAITAAMQTIL